MTTVTITIQRASVLADVKVKNHHEAALIPDSKERYLAEAGTEKLPELHQCITDAFADLSAMLRPFLVSGAATTTANDTYSATGDLVLAFSLTSRKAPGLAVPLTNAVHKYVVDSALAKFYKAVAHPVLAQAREVALPGDVSAIEGLLYRRKNPVYLTSSSEENEG